MDEQEDQRGPRERAYDERISPLMTQIIAAAKEAGIPLFFSAVLDREGPARDEFMVCTTNLPDGEGSHLIENHMGVARTRSNMTPKEERLLRLVYLLANHGARCASDQVQRMAHVQHEVPRCAPYGTKPVVGNVVVCTTYGLVGLRGRFHPFTVGIVREIRSENEMLLQELGGTNTCWVSNEQFCPIIGLEPETIERLAQGR
jgi:hypothetical protein